MQGEKQEAGKQVLAITAAGEKDASSAAWSCMDGLWEALSKGAELRAGQPVVLAQAVRALLGLWQVQVPKRSHATAVAVITNIHVSLWPCGGRPCLCPDNFEDIGCIACMSDGQHQLTGR